MKSLRSLLMRLLASASLLSVASAFSASVAVDNRRGLILEDLKITPLARASDGQAVTLPSLWRADTPFGIGDETAHASQLRDRVLSANTKLFFVGIGTPDAAKEFATQLNIDPAFCFGDEGGVVGETLGLEKGLKTMWNPSVVGEMQTRNGKEGLEDLGNAYKNAIDNVGFQGLAPKDAKDTLRQGGTFIFRGSELLFEHFDSKVGDNADIDDILAIISR